MFVNGEEVFEIFKLVGDLKLEKFFIDSGKVLIVGKIPFNEIY